MKLPIYHGTDDGVLSHAVGHIRGSSLPVGGESTHCALSARRGLPIIFVLMLSVLLLTTVAEAANKPNTAVDVSRSCTLTLQYAASGQAVRLYRAADISPAGLYTLLCAALLRDMAFICPPAGRRRSGTPCAARCWRVSRGLYRAGLHRRHRHGRKGRVYRAFRGAVSGGQD